MHVPDGFLDAPTSVATGVVAAVGIGLALRGARRELDDRTAPLAGLVATFIFATQMLNFPVGAVTIRQLLGGALAAVLVGPATALLCMSVVFLVQCLLFADGGITALGTNIFLMGIVTVVVGWAVFRGLQMVLPQRVSSVPAAAAGAALVSVPVAALAFVGLYAVGEEQALHEEHDTHAEHSRERPDQHRRERPTEKVAAGAGRDGEVQHLGREDERRDQAGHRRSLVVELSTSTRERHADADHRGRAGGGGGGGVEEPVGDVHAVSWSAAGFISADPTLLHIVCDKEF